MVTATDNEKMASSASQQAPVTKPAYWLSSLKVLVIINGDGQTVDYDGMLLSLIDRLIGNID